VKFYARKQDWKPRRGLTLAASPTGLAGLNAER